MKSFYLYTRFYLALGTIILTFAFSYSFGALFIVGQGLLAILFALTIYDFLRLKEKSSSILVQRDIAPQLSLGDEQVIKYTISNTLTQPLDYVVFDELPQQLQIREAIATGNTTPHEEVTIFQTILPLSRGVYAFGDIQLFLKSAHLGLVQYRKTITASEDVQVYPSIIQMKKYELQVFSKTANLAGVRKIRSIGENDEFEYIRAYNQGDNIKSINWKATSRRGELVVNQYQNTRSQSVYCIVDKGRSMRMPFEGLSLLDYAINSTLVLSNIILKKFDNAGLITFSDKIGTVLPPKGNQGQLQLIARQLYDQKTNYLDSNFELLFYTIKKLVKRRSILLLFSNFEQPVDMTRNLSYLRSLSKQHLLIVILFRNTEIEKEAQKQVKMKSDIYQKTFAQYTEVEKEKISLSLNRNGIDTILTTPKKLSIDVINKYLEIKAKRMR